MRLITITLILLILTSCGSTKEMRRSNRAAKKLERLVEKFPELKRTDTIMTPVMIKTPEVSGTIIQPFLLPGEKEFITLPGKPIFVPGEIDPFSIPFNDNVINALFSYDGTDFLLDYTIKPMQVDTIVRTEVQTIQATEYERIPLAWWQITLMVAGAIFIVIFILAIIGIITKTLTIS